MNIILDKKRMLILIISIQLIAFGSISFSVIRLSIPILREFITIIYLLLIPGILIVRIFNLDIYLNDIIDIILFSVGLSTVVLIFWGIFINFLYPILDIKKPFSELPLTVGIFILTILLTIICYFNDSQMVYSVNVRVTYIIFVSSLLPFLSIFGTYLLNYQDDNTLLLLLFGVISIFPIFVAFDKIRDQEQPFVIWTISLSLLLYRALTNPTTTGEKYMPAVVEMMGRWDPFLKAGHNMLLPNVILHPIFIILCNISFPWEVRIIHPLIFSIVPVLLYQVFKRQVNSKIAFLSSFFFMSVFPFYKLLAVQIRTPMAIFFLCFLEFLIIDKSLSNLLKYILVVIFSFMLITSHYGTSYIFMIVLIVSTILLAYIKDINNKKIPSLLCRFNFLIFYIVMAFGWYIFTASGARYYDIVNFFHHLFKEISKEVLSPEESYTLYALKAHYALSIEILEKLYMLSIFFMIVGIINELYKTQFLKFEKIFNREYLIISTIFLGVIFSTILPTKAYNTARVVSLSSAFLAPFCILGGIYSLKLLGRLIKKQKDGKTNTISDGRYLKVIAVFLMIFFLFNSGFISETITKDYAPYSVIGKKRIMESNNIYYKIFLYRMYAPECDIFASAWITKHADSMKIIYSDFFISEGRLRYRNSYLPEYGIIPGNDKKPREHIIDKNATIWKGNYIFLGYHNIKEGFIVYHWNPVKYFNTSDLLPILKNSSKIYTNGGSVIYLRQ